MKPLIFPFGIGIVNLSYACTGKGALVARGAISFLQRDHPVRVGRTAFSVDGYRSASIARRAAELQEMFANPAVDVILNVGGGYSANEILGFLDQRVIRANPKPFVGYSDITALNLGLFTMGVPTVCGPMLQDYGPDPDALPRLLTFLSAGILSLERPAMLWERGEKKRKAPPIRALPEKRRTAAGPLIAANLSTFNLLLGTPFMPSLKGAVLFLEYDKEESQALPSLQRMLWQIRQNGVFERITALVFGLPQDVVKQEGKKQTVRSILKEVTDGYDFPVLLDAPFGHIYPSWILPLGKRVKIDGNLIAGC